jgi:hypothetical protein
VSDAGVAHLKNLKTLRSLSLEGTAVSAAGVAELRAALPQCTVHGGKQ